MLQACSGDDRLLSAGNNQDAHVPGTGLTAGGSKHGPAGAGSCPAWLAAAGNAAWDHSH